MVGALELGDQGSLLWLLDASQLCDLEQMAYPHQASVNICNVTALTHNST